MNGSFDQEKWKHIFASEDLTDYRGIPVWSWNNTLDKAVLVKQIEDMKEAGLGGFIMHARIGLKDEYMGEKWFSCIEACLDKAKELHMNAWVYDENGWPSGFVGGKLLEREDFLAQYLTYEVKDRFDSEAFAIYVKQDETFLRVEAECGAEAYHCVYLCSSPANTDILNPEVVDAFIEQTHEQYYRRFADRFGKELVGFFTDEPQCYRWATPYSRFVRAEYEALYGEDIRDGLIWLFHRYEEGVCFRVRYYTVMNRLYTERFYKRLYDWCAAHNCKLTGHSIEEASLGGQMLGGAGVMPSYEYQQIPGIDCLGRDCINVQAPKQVSSVASQLGIHQVLTETFACGGHDTTPRELKSIADGQLFNGVNLICHHLFPYSLSAQGKSDHPPVFSRQANWWEQFRTFNEYLARLGYLVANTRERYDVAVVSPLRSVYIEHVRGDRSCRMNDEMNGLLNELRKNGVCYQILDEGLLEKYGRVEGELLVLGNCRYQTVIVPDMPNLSRATNELLQRFGGKLLMRGTPTHVDGVKEQISLHSNTTMQEIIANAAVRFCCVEGDADLNSREGKLGDFLLIKNYSRTKSARVVMKGVAEHYRALDLLTLQTANISNDIVLEPCGSLILTRHNEAVPTVVHYDTVSIKDRFRVTDISENYHVLDTGRLSYDGVQYGENLPLQRIFEDLLRFDFVGKVWIEQRFTVKEKLTLTLMSECGFVSATLNGRSLQFEQSSFDPLYLEATLTDDLVEGENVLVFVFDYHQHEGVHYALFDPNATESLRNCLYYDTHIESSFLRGAFVLNDEHVLLPQTNLPVLNASLASQGYPFFYGTLTACGSVELDEITSGKHYLALSGRFLAAEVTVNGTRRDILFENRCEIGDLLQKGSNEIKLVLRSSLRNLYGPHHWKVQAEPNSVNPFIFTQRGDWNGGIASRYTPIYQSVPFGADEIEFVVAH